MLSQTEKDLLKIKDISKAQSISKSKKDIISTKRLKALESAGYIKMHGIGRVFAGIVLTPKGQNAIKEITEKAL